MEANAQAARDAAPGEDVEAALRARLGRTPHLSFRYEPDLAAVWLRLEPRPLPCFTPESIDSISRMQQALSGLWGRTSATPSQPVKFLVVTSDAPRAFSTGGDLAHIVSRIEARDDVGLRAYGHAGTRACHALLDGCGAALVTVALVRGLALGSGFEAARCCDYVVAEEGCQFGLPEARFRLFPGNGAISALSRRLGGALVHRLVLGREELDGPAAKAAGVVDVLAPGGGGEEAVRGLLRRTLPMHAAAVAVLRGLREAEGVSLPAMLAETDRWAEAALSGAPDLDAMRRIVAVQSKRLSDKPRIVSPCR